MGAAWVEGVGVVEPVKIERFREAERVGVIQVRPGDRVLSEFGTWLEVTDISGPVDVDDGRMAYRFEFATDYQWIGADEEIWARQRKER